MTRWQLQDAKNRLSEVVRKASTEGPQVITLRGEDAVVVVAADEYARQRGQSKKSLLEFFRESPLGLVTLDLTRSRDAGRRVKL